jgi:hypothetical protein
LGKDGFFVDLTVILCVISATTGRNKRGKRSNKQKGDERGMEKGVVWWR